jgi:hypothetical protein
VGGTAATLSTATLNHLMRSYLSARGIHRDPSVVIAVCNWAISRPTALECHQLSPEKLNSKKAAFKLYGTRGLPVSYRYVSGRKVARRSKRLSLSECYQARGCCPSCPSDFRRQVSRIERLLENMVRSGLSGEDRVSAKPVINRSAAE